MNWALRRSLPVLSVMISVYGGDARAQGRRADFERAARLPTRTRNTVFRARVQPHWFHDNTRFWYRNDLANGRREFILVDALKGTRRPAFDHARVAAALTQALGRKVAPDRLPVDSLEYLPDETAVRLFGEGRAWEYQFHTNILHELKDIPSPASSLPPGDVPRPSSRTGEETTLTFVNVGDREVELFWMDPEGQRRSYGVLRPGERRSQHTFAGHVWLAADREGRLYGVFEATADPATAVISGERPAAPSAGASSARPRVGAASPDNRWLAFVRESNIWLRDGATGEVAPLTRDGSSGDSYREDALFWSPDSRRLAALKTKAGDDRKVYIVESSPKDQVQPRLHSYPYLKPGDRIPTPKPHLFDPASRREIPVSDALFPIPWDITETRWEPDSRRFTFVYNQRGHQVLRVVAVDADTGAASVLVDEHSRTFIDYAGKLFFHPLDDTHELLWMSERNGWNHLYLYDTAVGKVKNPVTRGAWVVRGVERVDAAKRQVWLRVSGIYPQQDPYHVHYIRVNFDGSGLTLLTEGDGMHTLAYSPDRRFYLDTWSRVDLPPVTELRRADDGKRVCLLERADASALLATGWRPPERFTAKGRDGRTDIYGVLLRPTNFDPKKRYPVVEAIYAGPQDSYVPKTWSAYYGMQEIAELGFLVVQIDGMGTSNRSKAFHDVCWKNLGDSGFPDRIRWMKAAARKYPYLDLSRVGIYGGSAGGQNALRALLAYPNFYRVGVADCGCHDNRMDKIWWNELWMGWPIGPHYAEQSNVTQAHRLQGKLLLVVGEMDTNVDPASTMQVVNALIKADKDFDLLVVPGGGHGIAETPYGRRRRQDFFVRHLLGVEPRSKP